MVKITINNLVVPKGSEGDWKIGKVIDLSHLDMDIGPLLTIRDIISNKVVERFPMHVDKLVIAK